LLGRDGVRTKELFGAALARDGGFTITPDEYARIAACGFVSGKSTHANRLATIRNTWQGAGVMVDTHTADGLKVAREHLQPGVPMIVLETALPAKFAATIFEATGVNPEPPPALRGIEALPKRFTEMAPDVNAVKRYIEAACAE
jgi:threonine synthase